MEKYKSTDKEFIDGIWRKVRYLDYLKKEEKIVKDKEKKLFKSNLKLGISTSLIVLSISIPLFIIFSFNIFTLTLFGIFSLGSSVLFEHLQTSNKFRRILNENRNEEFI